MGARARQLLTRLAAYPATHNCAADVHVPKVRRRAAAAQAVPVQTRALHIFAGVQVTLQDPQPVSGVYV